MSGEAGAYKTGIDLAVNCGFAATPSGSRTHIHDTTRILDPEQTCMKQWHYIMLQQCEAQGRSGGQEGPWL